MTATATIILRTVNRTRGSFMAWISNETPYHQGAARNMSIHRPKITATALLLIGVAVGGVATALRARSAPPQTVRPAFADPAGDQYRVTLSGGTTLEVVGILKDYKTWYRPDGTPLDESPADPSGDAYSVKTGEQHQTILVRVKNLPKDATLKWVPTYDQGCYDYRGDGRDQGRPKHA